MRSKKPPAPAAPAMMAIGRLDGLIVVAILPEMLVVVWILLTSSVVRKSFVFWLDVDSVYPWFFSCHIGHCDWSDGTGSISSGEIFTADCTLELITIITFIQREIDKAFGFVAAIRIQQHKKAVDGIGIKSTLTVGFPFSDVQLKVCCVPSCTVKSPSGKQMGYISDGK